MRIVCLFLFVFLLTVLCGCYSPPQIISAVTVTSSETAPENKVFMLAPDIPLNMTGIGRGQFVMGAQHYDASGLYVGHKVTLTNPFWISPYEFTQGQYKALMNVSRFPHNVRCPFKDMHNDRLPLCCLSWDEAQAIIDRLNKKFHSTLPAGYRFALPTEAQWEYACRAGTTGTFNDNSNLPYVIKEIKTKNSLYNYSFAVYLSKSRNLDELAWYENNSNDKIHEVGQKKPNLWKLYDMHGNIHEWCSDWYDYYRAPAEYEFRDRALNLIDPTGRASRKGPAQGHVLRGGLFSSLPVFTASWMRNSENSCNQDHFFWDHAGFRPVLSKASVEKIDSADSGVYGVDWTYARVRKASEAEIRDIILDHSLDIALIVLDASVKITDQIIEYEHAKRGGSYSSSSISGNGRIQGPDSLKRGKIGTYQLYIKGKKISSSDIRWRASGTSITVNDCGNYARVMAGNPPAKSFNTRIEAQYGGRRFTKNIKIFK